MAILTEERAFRGEYKSALLNRVPTRDTVSSSLQVLSHFINIEVYFIFLQEGSSILDETREHNRRFIQEKRQVLISSNQVSVIIIYPIE